MGSTLKIELKKALCSRMFLLALGIGCIPAVLAAVYNVIWYMDNLKMTAELSIDPSKYMELSTLFNHWIGGEASSLGSAMFFYIFPVLVAIPYAWSYCEERVNGYRQLMMVKCGKRNYITSKYITAFVSGGLAMVLPLAFNFILTAMFIPMIMPSPTECVYYGVFGSSMMSLLYYTHPVLYVLAYIGIDFVFGGLLACLGVVFSAFIRFKVLTIILPMFVCLGVDYMCRFVYIDSTVVYKQIVPFYFLRGIETAYPASGMVILAEGAILLAVILIAGIREVRGEVY